MRSSNNYGIKDPDLQLGYTETEWLTPHQVVINKLKIRPPWSSLSSTSLSAGYVLNLNSLLAPHGLIYPNELIWNDSMLVDLILLAKFCDKFGNLKLKSVLLSQLINMVYNNKNNCESSSENNRLYILSLSKDSYYWHSSSEQLAASSSTHILPRYALRVGYDSAAKQFSYIGRTKLTSLTNSSNSAKITNLFGALINVYEYIPAIVLQLHELTNPNLKLSIKNANFNLTSANYEVLCLRRQPPSLKQACILKLTRFEEDYLSHNSKTLKCPRSLTITTLPTAPSSLFNLPNSIRQLLWPSHLSPGQFLSKSGKMRSSNDLYEISVTEHGLFKLIKWSIVSNSERDLTDFDSMIPRHTRQATIFEKNIESLLVSPGGVYLIYDNNQATRRPIVLYKHTMSSNSSQSSVDQLRWSVSAYKDEPGDVNFQLALSALDHHNFVLHLSNSGFLRVLVSKPHSRRRASSSSVTTYAVINLLDLNELIDSAMSYRASLNKYVNSPESKSSTSETSASAASAIVNIENLNRSLYISVRLVTSLNDVMMLPVKLIDLVANVIKSLVRFLLVRPNTARAATQLIN